MTSRNAGDYIEATIVASTTVRIERLNNNSAWEHPVHAINWFDTRLLLLYNFYNLLAGRSVARVGGTPLVKGKLISRIVGTDASQRQILLLVRYPSPAQFKTMLESTYFKLVSVLRGLAVKNFTFCLSHAQGVTPVIPSQIPRLILHLMTSWLAILTRNWIKTMTDLNQQVLSSAFIISGVTTPV